ncbi:alpha/beta hydrolase [Spirillospora sp. CA-142024]|uniref:alpha/beta hydrolase n=1 Tax=Spirillospora sp. CA-142024 TaxID=3240036 RepID=UPI003D91FA38
MPPADGSGPSGGPETGVPGTGAPGSGSPSASSPAQPENGQGATDGEPDGTVTAQAVMVTPQLPKVRTYAYGKDAAQRIDAYWREPGPRATPRPALLLLHGGYWMEGDKAGSWRYFARRLTEEGFVVLSANYRLAPKAQWPAQRNDAMSALAFIKKHARVWDIDPNRVAVMGSSAGGQLATQLGTFGTGTRQVRGVIGLSPPNNPFLAFQDGAKPGATFTERKLRRAVADLVRCVPGLTADPDCWTRLDDASTLTHVSAGDAPMLLMHATGDFVPVTQSTGLASALRAAGVQATVKTIDGDMHASEMLEDEHTYPTILAWLKKLLNPGQ